MGDKYSGDYRHFDNLIWQVPSWASATFALAATAAGIISDTQNFAEIRPILGVFLLIVAIVFSLLWIALFRFRVHQTSLPRIPRVKHYRLIPGGQTALQLIMSVEAGALYAASLTCFLKMLPLTYAVALASFVATAIAIAATIWADIEIKKVKEMKPRKRKRKV